MNFPDAAAGQAEPAQRRLYVAEPALAYRLEPPVVVDCSTMAALIFDEPNSADAERQLAGKSLHAPTLLPYEIANVARNKQRSGLPSTTVAAALAEFADYHVQLVALQADELLALALRYNLSAYDAAYLALAGRLRAPLATFDKRLFAAAQQHLDPAG